MAAKARFNPNNRDIGRMLRSQQMEREMYVRADTVKGLAEARAPRRTGQYATSFEVTSGQSESPIKLGTGDRAWAMVRNTAPNAVAVEFGNARFGEGLRVLGQAVDQVTRE